MTDVRTADVAIIGGGASGLAAAVELGMSSPELDVIVIEKMPEPGRKLRATGSGRCNITNTGAAGYKRIMEFFREIGLVTRTYDNGLVYPYSESASDVAGMLIGRAVSLGAHFSCNEEVLSVKLNGDKEDKEVKADKDAGYLGMSGEPERRFIIESLTKDKDGEHRIITAADNIILATGGKAGPSYGTTGDGYRFARGLGHSIVTPVPALTSVECREWDDSSEPCAVVLGGTRSRGIVSLYKDETEVFDESSKIFEEEGEIQFTKFGLSGICVFNMTRHMRFDRSEGGRLDDFLVRIDLFAGGDIRDYIRDRQEGFFADSPAGELLCTVLREPVAEYIMQAASVGDALLSSLSVDGIEAIASRVHALEFHPSQIRGWKDAQVTMGGVSIEEIDEATCESKLVPGLYITGELADRDYQCGGFNLSNAWITGLAAADSIGEK